MDRYTYLANADTAVIEDLYQSYLQNPESVDYGWQKFFEGFDFSKAFPAEGASGNGNGHAEATPASAKNVAATASDDKEIRVRNLIHAYRTRGHLRSKTNPVRPRKDRKARLD